jgi:hypothetical protein
MAIGWLPYHKHISERKPGPWNDCAWASLIMFLRSSYRPDLPATLAEAQAFRHRVMGPTGGTPINKLAEAAKLVVNVDLHEVTGFDALWSTLTIGHGALVNGSMGAFPIGSPLRRFDPGFAGGHSVYVARVDMNDRVWWDNPLAPTGTYNGEWVSKAQLQAFVAGNWTHAVAPLKKKPAVVAPALTPTTTSTPTPTPAPTAVVYTQAQLDAAVAAEREKIAAALATYIHTL